MQVAGLFNGRRSEDASGWVGQWREVMLPDESIETLAIYTSTSPWQPCILVGNACHEVLPVLTLRQTLCGVNWPMGGCDAHCINFNVTSTPTVSLSPLHIPRRPV